MSWPKGVDVIEDLLVRGHLERVPADPDEAVYLLERARQHLATAQREAQQDPEIAYGALYAAARKALTAVLRHQGLRPTRQGVTRLSLRPRKRSWFRRPGRSCARTVGCVVSARRGTIWLPTARSTRTMWRRTCRPPRPSWRRRPRSSRTCPSSCRDADPCGGEGLAVPAPRSSGSQKLMTSGGADE